MEGNETKKIDDGGPAFPIYPLSKCGMSLRDYFATHYRAPTEFELKHMSEMDHAITLADKSCMRRDRNQCDLETEWRYAMADSMLRARTA